MYNNTYYTIIMNNTIHSMVLAKQYYYLSIVILIEK